MNRKRVIRTAIVASALTITAFVTYTWATATAGPVSSHFVMPAAAQPAEDDPAWDCHTQGNRLCQETKRVHPVTITGHFREGFAVVWSDGHTTQDGPWEDIVRECKRDAQPAVCLTAWAGEYRKFGEERAIIRWLR